MGKRSDFQKIDKGKYYTPLSAVLPLLPLLSVRTKFIEPCAGDGRLAAYLEEAGHSCVYACDIEPAEELHKDAGMIHWKDAAKLEITDFPPSPRPTHAITNPPWPLNGKKGDPAISIIRRMLRLQLITWVLLPAEFMHYEYAAGLLRDHGALVKSIGRVKWIEGSKHGAMESCCWYQFVPWLRVGDRGPTLLPKGY